MQKEILAAHVELIFSNHMLFWPLMEQKMGPSRINFASAETLMDVSSS
jgi:hypothetical protein